MTNPFSHPTIDEAPSMENEISFSFFSSVLSFRLVIVSYIVIPLPSRTLTIFMICDIGDPKPFESRSVEYTTGVVPNHAMCFHLTL